MAQTREKSQSRKFHTFGQSDVYDDEKSYLGKKKHSNQQQFIHSFIHSRIVIDNRWAEHGAQHGRMTRKVGASWRHEGEDRGKDAGAAAALSSL